MRARSKRAIALCACCALDSAARRRSTAALSVIVVDVPKRRFVTDEQGRVPNEIRLLPSTAYVAEPTDGPPADRLKSAEELVSWIRNCVLGDLRTLRLGIDERIKQPQPSLGGGNFLLFAGCLMALEYFARIYVADGDAVTRVRKYADAFLVPVNARYKEACGILWRAARNGMIHGSWPRRISIEGDNKEYMFAVGNEPGDRHLEFHQGYLNVSGPRLLCDLETSVDAGFSRWLREKADAAALERAQPRVLEMKSSDPEVKHLRAMMGWSQGHRDDG